MTSTPITRSGHVIVFGVEGVARRIIRQLLNAGQDIVVVDPSATAQELADLQRWGVDYFEGSGQRENTLRDLSLATATAALCVNDDDLRNIEIALLVREFAPDLRIVIYAANAAVGRAMEHIAKPGAVLDVAQLASGSFLETMVQRSTHAIEFAGETFIVATFRNEAKGRLRSVWRDLAPIAVQPAGSRDVLPCPGRDLEAGRGDLVTLIGTADDYQELGVTLPRERAAALEGGFRRSLRRTFAAFSDAVDRPFRIALGVLIALGVFSVAVLTFGYEEPDGTQMSPFDAIYFTSETIATVGFGDFYFRDQQPWLRMWAVVLILMGATLVAVTTALLTNALVSRRLAQSLGRQRLTEMRDHMVVIGLGSVGIKVVTDLQSAGYQVAVIDRSESNKYIPQVRAAGIPIVFGDATLPETLSAVGVDRAAGVAVLTSDDLINIETGLAVRDATSPRTVPIALRLFERDLARVVGRSLDVGTARSTAELAAPWFVGAALGLEILGTFYVGPTLFLAASMTVRAGSGLDGLAMRDLAGQARVIAIHRSNESGRLEHPPRRDAAFAAGDTAYLIGQYQALMDVLQKSW
ncbi:MAG: NAD-binding protein [Candidatus Nanopelagicales bacterium]|nr:NAD-binding protein [Candidatus Nanopelagicales bacterium]